MLALPVLQFLRGVDIREPPRFIGKIHLHGFVTAQPVAGPAFALFQAVLPESPVLQRGIKVWGPLVRLFHWLLVAAFTIVWLTSEEESRLHELAGVHRHRPGADTDCLGIHRHTLRAFQRFCLPPLHRSGLCPGNANRKNQALSGGTTRRTA